MGPTDFMVWHEFVCFTLRQEDKTKQRHETRNADVISVLCKSVEMILLVCSRLILISYERLIFSKEKMPDLLFEYGALGSVGQARCCFKLLLRLDRPPVLHRMSTLHLFFSLTLLCLVDHKTKKKSISLTHTQMQNSPKYHHIIHPYTYG